MADQPLPPGVVPMEDAIRSQASMSNAAPRLNLGDMYADYVASPLTKLVQGVLSAPSMVGEQTFGRLATGLGLSTPEQQQAITQRETGQAGAIASTVVPQNLTEAGIMAGTMGAGGIAGKAGLTGLKAGATRVAGAVAGGMAGKAADEGAVDTGTLAKGGAQGLAAGVTGEAIGAGLSYARKAGMERSIAKRDLLDASAAAGAIQNNPKLKGVFGQVPTTPEGLRDLALGTVPDPANPGKVISKGEALVGQYLDQADQQINAKIQQQAQQYGRTYQFPDPYTPGVYKPYDEARESLTKLGRIAGKIKPQQEITIGGERLSGGDVKELYANTLRAWQQQLARIDPQALTAFNESRAANEAAGATLDLLGKLFKGSKLADRIAMNSETAQNLLANNQKQYTNKLGIDGFNALAQAFRVSPERLGMKDVLNPSGAMSTLAGVVPLPGAAYARVHIGSPQLVGNPFGLSGGTRTGIDIGASQLLGRGLDFSPSAGQVLQAGQGLFPQ